ncbi:TolC family protein [Phaeocystidibacter luteus]|uniref:TolC family protein n=1 Tax=Phaeocystidibacter luteus TaxID=911197 RepID=A0A6N6RF36_9FLAO|nr:TolC family protein [Phaeocystidibacter luteus]KAB2808694.1 TolC family protein [Phaeocystidibacter luteus]
MNKSILICSSLALAATSAFGQTQLTLDSAITRAVQENHGIAIARNNTSIASNNARPGVSGLYPTISATGGANITQNDTEIEFVTGEVQNVDAARTASTNANIGMSYVIFDGMRNWKSFRQAQTQEDASFAQQRLTVENTLVSVIAQYYEVARQTQNVQVAEEAIAISLDRYERAELRKELGAGVTLDLLNAEVDLNRDSVSYRTAYTQLQNAKRNLTVLLATNPSTDFEVDTTVEFASLLPLQDFKERALEQNASLVSARKNQRASEYAIGVASSGYWPTLSLNGGYGFNRQDAEAGFLVSNQATGWNAGLTLRWNLWDGQVTQTRTDNARLQAETARRQVLNTEQQLMTDIENAYNTYVNALYVMRTEERNVETSRLNFQRTRESFQLGQVTNTTFREAQLNFIRSQAALLDAKYLAKVAEIRLLQLSGILLNNN